MTITDLNDLIANIIGPPVAFGKNAVTASAAGIPHTPWYAAGLTGTGSAPSGGLNGAVVTGPSLSGQIPVPVAVTGETTVIERLSLVQAGNVGAVWLIDRMWGDVPVVTTTGAQAITSPAWPARDTAASTAGAGVLLALECSAATGNGVGIANTTVSYTNSAGTSGRTATVGGWPAAAPQGTFVVLSLQAGDIGVQSVQSITLGNSYISGAVHLIAFRYVTDLATPQANVGARANFMDLGLPTVWNATVLQLVYWPTGTAIGAVSGSITYAQG